MIFSRRTEATRQTDGWSSNRFRGETAWIWNEVKTVLYFQSAGKKYFSQKRSPQHASAAVVSLHGYNNSKTYMPIVVGMYVSTVCTYVRVHICWRQDASVPSQPKKTQQVACVTCFSEGECTFYSVHFQFVCFSFRCVFEHLFHVRKLFPDLYSGGPSLLSGSAKRLLLGLVYWSLGIVFTLWSRFSSCRLCWTTYFVYKVASKSWLMYF